NEVSILENPMEKNKSAPKKRGREDEAPSVQTAQTVSMPTTSTKPSTYMCRKNKSPVKEKTPEVEAPRKPLTKEKSPEEEEEAESPIKETPLKEKCKRVEEEVDSEETDSLENYMGKRE
ncbi:hypothetical protein KI387_042481, partial [Taxus chinensis]